MIKVLRIYTIVFCVLLFLSETAVLVMTDKFWLFSVDDYIAIIVLLLSLRSLRLLQGQLLQLVTWGYLSGKFYTLIFVRLNPAMDTSEPVLALSVLLIEVLAGLTLVALCLRTSIASSANPLR
ncbi:MAG: hypothetical protein ACI883_000876 [Candidatus Azotimanducaceae bacterium]|jgi:hypothetical protein|tara:strand:- start:11374 stop:11742 length:369 start_codon:yes stop_codon:yes gene_type:complete